MFRTACRVPDHERDALSSAPTTSFSRAVTPRADSMGLDDTKLWKAVWASRTAESMAAALDSISSASAPDMNTPASHSLCRSSGPNKRPSTARVSICSAYSVPSFCSTAASISSRVISCTGTPASTSASTISWPSPSATSLPVCRATPAGALGFMMRSKMSSRPCSSMPSSASRSMSLMFRTSQRSLAATLRTAWIVFLLRSSSSFSSGVGAIPAYGLGSMTRRTFFATEVLCSKMAWERMLSSGMCPCRRFIATLLTTTLRMAPMEAGDTRVAAWACPAGGELFDSPTDVIRICMALRSTSDIASTKSAFAALIAALDSYSASSLPESGAPGALMSDTSLPAQLKISPMKRCPEAITILKAAARPPLRSSASEAMSARCPSHLKASMARQRLERNDTACHACADSLDAGGTFRHALHQVSAMACPSAMAATI
mmetsp:Transcript_23725/g.61622  ORF Transcript_23725/g.61622 Transcript_23725/m.61622 type:complete len:433 (+) Transcript_23725:479-1777(+)